jgi:hypothetical protein
MLDKVTGNSTIEESSFVKTRKLAGYTIYASGNTTALSSITIAGCCFTGRLDDEVKIVAPTVLGIPNGSLFEESCETFLVFVLPRVIGYLADPDNMTPIPWADRIFKGMVVRLLAGSLWWVLAGGSCCGIILWILIRRIPQPTMPRRTRRRNRRAV